jgi:hypothetical protein
MSHPPRAFPRRRLLEICDTTHRLAATANAAYLCQSQGRDAEAPIEECSRLHEELCRLIEECLGRMPGDPTPGTLQEAEVGGALQAVAVCCRFDDQSPLLPQFDALWHAGDRLRNAINAVPVSLLDALDDVVPNKRRPAVVLGGPNDNPRVRGKPKPLLTSARYAVVKALVDAGEAGLSKGELENRSKKSDAVKCLRSLRKTDPDWSEAILMAGGPWGRYRILHI